MIVSKKDKIDGNYGNTSEEEEEYEKWEGGGVLMWGNGDIKEGKPRRGEGEKNKNSVWFESSEEGQKRTGIKSKIIIKSNKNQGNASEYIRRAQVFL